MTEKLLISRNTAVIEAEKQKAVNALPYLQRIIDEGKKAELVVTNENLHAVLTDPIEFAQLAYKKSITHVPTLNGRPMKKEALLDAYEFPDTTAFADAVFMYKKVSNQTQKQFLTIVDGKACLNKDELSVFIDKCSRYATHPKAIELYEAYGEMLKSTNIVNAMLSESNNDRMNCTNLNRFIDWDGKEFTLRIPVYLEMIKKFDR